MKIFKEKRLRISVAPIFRNCQPICPPAIWGTQRNSGSNFQTWFGLETNRHGFQHNLGADETADYDDAVAVVCPGTFSNQVFLVALNFAMVREDFVSSRNFCMDS